MAFPTVVCSFPLHASPKATLTSSNEKPLGSFTSGEKNSKTRETESFLENLILQGIGSKATDLNIGEEEQFQITSQPEESLLGGVVSDKLIYFVVP